MPESRGDKIGRNEEMPRRETESRSFEREKETGGWRRDHSQDSKLLSLDLLRSLIYKPQIDLPAGRSSSVIRIT